jgi:RNA polymerase sigma-70 factor (ECF subfamily)
MGELDDTKRMVFILYEVEGYSHAEIASVIGIAESSSRTLLTRAKRILQDHWNKEMKQ